MPFIYFPKRRFAAIVVTGRAAQNEVPRSKQRGIAELKHSKLPEIYPRLALQLHIPFYGVPVAHSPTVATYVPIGPKLPTPQDSLHHEVSTKELSYRDALEPLHNPSWSHFRMRTTEQMNVILLHPNRFHLNRKPFRNLGRRLLDNRRHRLIQQRLPVFHGEDNVIVDWPRTGRSLLTASSLWSTILQRVPYKIVPVASYGESQVHPDG